MIGITDRDFIQIHWPLVLFAYCCSWVSLPCLSSCLDWNNREKKISQCKHSDFKPLFLVLWIMKLCKNKICIHKSDLEVTRFFFLVFTVWIRCGIDSAVPHFTQSNGSLNHSHDVLLAAAKRDITLLAVLGKLQQEYGVD